jgi:tRNA-splicing ligase RtcB
METIKTFGTVDERSLEQLKRCMEAGDADFGVLCADHHPGYSQPIGGGIAYEAYVSPSGVGFDIGCGNKASQTDMTRADIVGVGGVESVMREITRRISFGMGVPAQERVDHPVLEKIRNADFEPQRKLAQVAASQPLREPDGGRGGPYLGRRPLRLARLRPQDRFGLPRARPGFAVRCEGSRG